MDKENKIHNDNNNSCDNIKDNQIKNCNKKKFNFNKINNKSNIKNQNEKSFEFFLSQNINNINE